MIRTLIKKCFRDKRIVAVATVLVIMAWYSRNETAANIQFEDEEAGESKSAVLISQRGHSNIPSHISSTHLYEETEGIRLRIISGTGIFSTVKSSKSGFVNAHFWFDLCGTDIRTLRNFPTFPNVPSARRLLPDLNFINLGEKYGKRVFGFIVAPESTSYDFRLLASGSAEFWLSYDEQPQNCHKVCHSSTANHDRNTVKEINLQKYRRYYFEIIHKHGSHRSEDYVVVQWKISNNQERFKTIPSNQLQSHQDDLNIEGDAVHVKSFAPPGLQMHQRDVISQPKELEPDIIRERVYSLPFISEELVRDLFPTCPYKPSYLVKNKLKRYGSVWENIYSSIYPTDDSNLTHANGFIAFGNDVLEIDEASTIVNMVLDQFKRRGLRNYQLKNIINIESKRGRYLVELQLLDVKTKRNVRFSEYVYLPQGSSQLCYPEGFKWNKTSMVNIIVTSGCNQGKWVYHFIRNMERIYQQTKDANFNVIINDFLSPHADIREALETSHLPNYLLFANTGTFQKSLGLQQAASSVVDGIVAILDLHLDMPSYFVDDIRKHAVAGFQAYSPVLARMDCGTNSVVRMGSHWEIGGYGLVGIYKEDWDLFGGMNVEEFKNKWGGEDNEMVDRILMAGYEIDRKKVKGLVHYFHTKHGMWNCKRR